MPYRIIDIFFVVFHTSLIIFNLTGWIWKKTRFLNLLILVMTGTSWLALGMIVGIPGYCPLTDWHFGVLHELGEKNLPSSYIKYLSDRITGGDVNSALIDAVTLYGFITALLVSVVLNIRDRIRSSKGR